eukprot:sb/3473878/
MRGMCARLDILHSPHLTILGGRRLRDAVSMAGYVYHPDNVELGFILNRCSNAAERDGQLDLAIDCMERAVHILKHWCGELSYTTAIKLLRLTVLRIKLLERNEKVDENLRETIVNDGKLCIQLFSELQITRHKDLEAVNAFLELN